MSKHLQNEIDDLKKSLIHISGKVEEALTQAIEALLERDRELAESVIEGDVEIDRLEVELEEKCLKILALHQPVAIDLRFIISALKMNSDLERIGDLAANLAERAEYLTTIEPVESGFGLGKMAERVKSMLRDSLDAVVNMDAEKAKEVCSADVQVDKDHEESLEVIADSLKESNNNVDVYLPYISSSRYLERIADHTTNIAEDVIYMLEGEIVRHFVDFE